jgi:hypothetical protein
MTATAPQGDIVARYDKRERTKWLIMSLLLLAGAGWFLRDGYVTYPAENVKAIEDAKAQNKAAPKPPHSDLDIQLQKVIGFGLVPAGLLLLSWTFYRSRGEYRLSGDVLHVPGHPPVPLEAIRAIDQSLWQRKGIARIDYEVNSVSGRLKLDDYVYERTPTDHIYERILQTVAPEEASATNEPAES